MLHRMCAAIMLSSIMLAPGAASQEADAGNARAIVAKHCMDCHRVPGVSTSRRNPLTAGPDFQAIANDRESYTDQRLEAFLRRPHFPMKQFTLSEGEIRELIAFIRKLGAKSTGNR